MAQRRVIVRGATNQALDELDATDIPDLSASYDPAGTAGTQVADTSAAHAASSIGFTPNGSISSTDVQAAIQEVRDEAGGSGSVATDTIWDAAGDLAVGTGADTAAKLTKGADSTVLTIDPSTHLPVWATPTGGGAPTDADYLVGTANGGLSAEIVVGTTPGGELGGTWASPTVDATHSGSAHHAPSEGVTVTRAATQSIAQNTVTPIQFSAVVVEDDPDYWDAGVNTDIIIQRSGWHAITGKAKWAAATGLRRNLIIDINGSGGENNFWNSGEQGDTIYNDPHMNVAGIEKLTAGDTVRLCARQAQSANLDISLVRFSVVFLGG